MTEQKETQENSSVEKEVLNTEHETVSKDKVEKSLKDHHKQKKK